MALVEKYHLERRFASAKTHTREAYLRAADLTGAIDYQMLAQFLCFG
jgi:hypothetical protein